MNKVISLVLVVAGVALLIYGWQANESISSDVSRALTNAPTDRTMWMLIGGGASLLVGLFGLSRGSSK